MGAALGIHPLAVLIVSFAGGALFGTVGLILAARLPPRSSRSRPISPTPGLSRRPATRGPQMAAGETVGD